MGTHYLPRRAVPCVARFGLLPPCRSVTPGFKRRQSGGEEEEEAADTRGTGCGSSGASHGVCGGFDDSFVGFLRG